MANEFQIKWAKLHQLEWAKLHQQLQRQYDQQLVMQQMVNEPAFGQAAYATAMYHPPPQWAWVGGFDVVQGQGPVVAMPPSKPVALGELISDLQQSDKSRITKFL